MTKRARTTLFQTDVAKPETPMDKTTRVARKLMDDEAEQRNIKNTRLRNARLEREANSPAENPAKATRKPGRSKAHAIK